MILLVNNIACAEWARERIPKVVSWLPGFKSIAAINESPARTMGVVVYDGFTPYDCNMHIAIEDRRCVTRRVVRKAFAYPFEQLGLARVTALVGATNARSQRFVTDLGFVCEGAKSAGLGDEDELIYGMTRERCRWL